MGGFIVESSGRALRPWPDLHALEVPNAFVAVFATQLVLEEDRRQQGGEGHLQLELAVALTRIVQNRLQLLASGGDKSIAYVNSREQSISAPP